MSAALRTGNYDHLDEQQLGATLTADLRASGGDQLQLPDRRLENPHTGTD